MSAANLVAVRLETSVIDLTARGRVFRLFVDDLKIHFTTLDDIQPQEMQMLPSGGNVNEGNGSDATQPPPPPPPQATTLFIS